VTGDELVFNLLECGRHCLNDDRGGAEDADGMLLIQSNSV